MATTTNANSKKKLPTWAWILIIVGGLFVLGKLVPAENEKAAINNNTPQVEQKQNAIEVSAKQIAADYSANEVSADNKYKGKHLKITGIIESINKDFTDEVYLTIVGNKETFTDLRCNFKDANAAANFSKGQEVTLIGFGAGMILGTPVVDNCVLAE